MSSEDYLAWLALAQRTAWVQYTELNPRAQELLLSTVRTFLVTLGDKDNVINSLFSDERKH
jgi:hypothetical protein